MAVLAVARTRTQDELNGSFRSAERRSRSIRPIRAHIPERFTIRVPGKGGSFNKANYLPVLCRTNGSSATA